MDAVFKHLENSGIRIPYYTWELRNPAAVLLLIHGLKSHAAWFLETGAAFAAQGIQVYLFDRRGSGQSECERGHADDYRDWLDDVRAMARFARQQRPGRPLHLLGHCFGAKLALGFALLHPGEAASLALIAPPQFALRADLNRGEKFRVALSLLWGRKRKLRVPIRDDMFTRDPDRCRFIREDPLRLDAVTAKFYLQTFRLDRWLGRSLPRLEAPTLVLLGSEDEVVDVGRVEKKFFPRLGCRRKALELYSAAHDLLFEPCREQVVDRVVDWIQEGDGLTESLTSRVAGSTMLAPNP